MKLNFRAMRSGAVPLWAQGKIYYALQHRNWTDDTLAGICERAVRDVCGQDTADRDMLMDYLTTDKSQDMVAMAHYRSPRTVRALHKKYMLRAYELMCMR